MIHYFQRITGALPGEHVFWGERFSDIFIEYLATKNIIATRSNLYAGITSWPKIKLWKFGFEAISYRDLKSLSSHLSTFIAEETTANLVTIVEEGFVAALGHSSLEEWTSIEQNISYWELISKGFNQRQFMWYLYSGQKGAGQESQYGQIFRTPDQTHALYLVYREAARRMELVEQLLPSFLWSFVDGEIDPEGRFDPVSVLDKRIVDVFCTPEFPAHTYEYKSFVRSFGSLRSSEIDVAAIDKKSVRGYAQELMSVALRRFLHGFIVELVEYSDNAPSTCEEMHIASAIDAGLFETERTSSVLVRQTL